MKLIIILKQIKNPKKTHKMAISHLIILKNVHSSGVYFRDVRENYLKKKKELKDTKIGCFEAPASKFLGKRK